MERHSASSLPRETGRAPAAYMNRASLCLGTLVAFCVNKVISASFFPLFSHLFSFFLILSLSLSKSFSLPTPSLLRVPLDPVGAGPQHSRALCKVYRNHQEMKRRRVNLKLILSCHIGASLVVQLVKNLPAMQETPVQFLGWEDPMEKG